MSKPHVTPKEVFAKAGVNVKAALAVLCRGFDADFRAYAKEHREDIGKGHVTQDAYHQGAADAYDGAAEWVRGFILLMCAPEDDER